MTTPTIVELLEDSGIITKMTEALVAKFEESSPYLPVLDSSEFSEFFEPALSRQLMSMVPNNFNGRTFPYPMLRAMENVESSPLIVLHKIRGDSAYDNMIFKPSDPSVRETILTTDFIEYLLASDALTPSAVGQLKDRLKSSPFKYIIELPDLPAPTDEELLDAIFEGLKNMAYKVPKKFRDEVSMALLKKSRDPESVSRTAIYDIVENVKRK